MARKKLQMELDEGRKITIKELKLRDIAENGKLLGELAKGFSLEKLQEILQIILPSCFEGIDHAELMELAPSEIKTIWEGFEQVNAVFLDTVSYQESKTLLLKVVATEIKKIHTSIQTALAENPTTQPNSSSISAPA